MSWESIFDPTPAEGQSRKLVCDLHKKGFGFRVSNWNISSLKVLHVVTAVISIEYSSLSSRSECLDCKELTFLHSRHISAFDNWHTLSGMDSVGGNRVSTKILDGLDRQDLVIDLKLMRLHDLLDGGTDVTETNIDTCGFDTFVGSFFHSEEEGVKNGVESHSEGAVNDVAVHLGSEIDFHHIVILENGLISWIWGVMGSTVVDTAACWESDSLDNTIGFY